MAVGNNEKNSIVGFIFGITSSIGFSIFSVTLRWRKETPKFTTGAIAGFFSTIFIAPLVVLTNLFTVFILFIPIIYFYIKSKSSW